MENLTNRQVELITNLLLTYDSYVHLNTCNEYKEIIFDGYRYRIYKNDYPIVCEIIDYIKGAKNNES